MRVHSGKPFPQSLFLQSNLKIAHFLTFWMLCNEIDADEEGWIRVSREDLESLYRQTQRARVPVLTQILNTLRDYEYIELVAYAPYRTYQTLSYDIRIKDDCWNADKKVFHRACPEKDRGRRTRIQRANLDVESSL